jgi:hypothetical protein
LVKMWAGLCWVERRPPTSTNQTRRIALWIGDKTID